MDEDMHFALEVEILRFQNKRVRCEESLHWMRVEYKLSKCTFRISALLVLNTTGKLNCSDWREDFITIFSLVIIKWVRYMKDK